MVSKNIESTNSLNGNSKIEKDFEIVCSFTRYSEVN